MKKLINRVEDVLSESLQGFQTAHRDIVSVNLEPKYVVRAHAPQAGKVALISGGGSGHEPLHAGFVGHGMLDGACPGEVFTSPTPDQILAAAEAVDGGAGVLFIIKNYSGDVMNFEMAMDLFSGKSASVVTHDDVAVENSLHSQGRRGVAATIVLEKVVGAAAESGADLAECQALAERVSQASGTMGVALSSCTVPAAGKATLQMGADEMEMGVGIHGEPGTKRVALAPADAIAQEMVETICQSIQPQAGDELIVLLNGMGGTPLMELYLMHHAVTKLCAERGLRVARSLVGNFCTSLEMAGCSITLTVADAEMIQYWDAPVHTATLRWGM